MAFKKIDQQGSLPGPRAVFISGYPEESFSILEEFLEERGFSGIGLVPCRDNMIDMTIKEVLESSSQEALIAPEKLPPVMLWSGITHQELDQIIRNFKDNGLPRPIFASSTVHNLDFTVKTLIQHLLADQREIREAQKKRAEHLSK